MIKFSSNIDKVWKKIDTALNKSLNDAPKVLGNEGQNFFSRQFAKQEYEGQKWQEVKRREPGTFEYKYPKTRDLGRRTRPILVGKTRRLKNAVTRSFRWGNKNKIIWGVSISYAQFLVEKRRFVSDGPRFRRALNNKYAQIFRQNLK